MKIGPIIRVTKRNVGLVVDFDHVYTKSGIKKLEDLDGLWELYSWRESLLIREMKEGKARGRYWRGRYANFRADKRKIHNTRDILSSVDPTDAFIDLCVWADWVQQCGANISSFGSTARSLWRTTLPTKIVIASSRLPIPGDLLMIGGRQDAKEGMYSEATLYDIRGAYQSAMRDLRVAARYRHKLVAIPFREFDWREAVGFARATIYLTGEMEWGPVPQKGKKRMRYPTRGSVEGIYDIAELKMAHELGAKIMIHEAWIGHGQRFPWKKWADLISEARSLPGMAKVISKAMGNSLWGSFAISGKGAWVHYENDRMMVTMDKNDKTPECIAVAAHVSAYMRARLYREAMAHYSAGPFCLAAHTDGVIFLAGGFPNGPMGDNVGQWQKRVEMQDLVLLDAQRYKYRNSRGIDRYVIAGCPPQFAPKIFGKLLQKRAEKQTRERPRHLLDLGAWRT